MNKPIEKLESPFMTLSAINVNGHTEKKGKFTYLSWPFAVSEISKADPSVTWEYPAPVTYPDGTMMVFCNVTAFGKTMNGFLPVMDNYNKSIKNPNAMDINKAMQRCLVKSIALHGLGLYIYSGEDLPEEPKNEAEAMAKAASNKGVTPTAGAGESLNKAKRQEIQEFAEGTQVNFDAGFDIHKIVEAIQEQEYDADEKVYFWSFLDSKCRTAIKKDAAKPTAIEMIAQA